MWIDNGRKIQDWQKCFNFSLLLLTMVRVYNQLFFEGLPSGTQELLELTCGFSFCSERYLTCDARDQIWLGEC